jgi:hypothetical protein
MRILTLLLICFSSLVFAQTPKEDFKVLSHKGANTVNNKPLSTGTKLFSSDQIMVSVGGYIGLLHKTGKTLELRQPGTYTVAEISQKVGSTNTSASKRYSDYVVKELTKGDKEDVNKNYMAHLTVTGSVERGSEDIQIFLPISAAASTNVIGNTLKINWKKVADGKLYVVKVMNNFDEIIFSKETDDTSYTILIDQLPLNNENSFICQVSLKDNSKNPSEKRQIKLIKNEKAKALTEEITEINANLADDNSINNFMKANFYKEKGLFIEASDCYLKAIKEDPEVTDYVDSYDKLLEENGLQSYMINKKK